jgi:large subunit ribosomal protein L11
MGKKKETIAQVKLHIRGGQATPAPPVGTALGPHGINMQDFCTQFNSITKDKQGELTPVVVSIYQDRSFDFITRTPPASELLKQAANIKKGSGEPNKAKVGQVTTAQLREIAEKKMEDLNAANVDHAVEMIKGTARSMGITVQG